MREYGAHSGRRSVEPCNRWQRRKHRGCPGYAGSVAICRSNGDGVAGRTQRIDCAGGITSACCIDGAGGITSAGRTGCTKCAADAIRLTAVR